MASLQDGALQIGGQEGQPDQLAVIGADGRGHVDVAKGAVARIPAQRRGQFVGSPQAFDENRVAPMAMNQRPTIGPDLLNPSTPRLTPDRDRERENGSIASDGLQPPASGRDKAIGLEGDPDLFGQQIDAPHRRQQRREREIISMDMTRGERGLDHLMQSLSSDAAHRAAAAINRTALLQRRRDVRARHYAASPRLPDFIRVT